MCAVTGPVRVLMPMDDLAPRRARSLLAEAHCPAHNTGVLDDAKLLVSELVTNAVKYGDGTQPVQLHAHWNGEVRIEVCDRNGGFSPGPRLAGLDEPGGFGLYLVGQLADRWGVETDGATTVWFVLRRQ
jgi:anti-sigma regulatory factor (Ser/Thr protein kinase)